jgi:hypothetical protein
VIINLDLLRVSCTIFPLMETSNVFPCFNFASDINVEQHYNELKLHLHKSLLLNNILVDLLFNLVELTVELYFLKFVWKSAKKKAYIILVIGY